MNAQLMYQKVFGPITPKDLLVGLFAFFVLIIGNTLLETQDIDFSFINHTLTKIVVCVLLISFAYLHPVMAIVLLMLYMLMCLKYAESVTLPSSGQMTSSMQNSWSTGNNINNDSQSSSSTPSAVISGTCISSHVPADQINLENDYTQANPQASNTFSDYALAAQ